jgi:hypothetical protein
VALGRTVFIDNAGIGTTDFTLTAAQQQQLVDNGVQATAEWFKRNEAPAVPPRVAAS